MTTDNGGAMSIAQFAAMIERGDFDIFFNELVATEPPTPIGYVPVILHVLNQSAVFAVYDPKTKMLRPLENIDGQWLPAISMNVQYDWRKSTLAKELKRSLLQDKPYIFNLILMGAALMTLPFNERTYDDDRP